MVQNDKSPHAVTVHGVRAKHGPRCGSGPGGAPDLDSHLPGR